MPVTATSPYLWAVSLTSSSYSRSGFLIFTSNSKPACGQGTSLDWTAPPPPGLWSVQGQPGWSGCCRSLGESVP